ncbi:MAG: flavodoxin domain-containing protein [Candidatus Thermoplasmatota archaeon]|nr:flavodoxin domain-containing protein [Candidatus Thermoplasmatota archaeon]
MNQRILVGYHSKGGASKTYATMIAETFISEGFSTDLIDLKERIPNVSAYDVIILGTGVRLSMVYGRWKKMLKQRSLHEKTLYLFLSSGMAMEEPEKAVEKYLTPLIKRYDLKPVHMISFPGTVPEKWAETDEQKHAVKPEKAKAWAIEIISLLR